MTKDEKKVIGILFIWAIFSTLLYEWGVHQGRRWGEDLTLSATGYVMNKYCLCDFSKAKADYDSKNDPYYDVRIIDQRGVKDTNP
jgi:hypothetical protein